MTADNRKWKGPTNKQMEADMNKRLSANAQGIVAKMTANRHCLNCQQWGTCITTPLHGLLYGSTYTTLDLREAKCDQHMFADWHVRRMEDLELAYVQRQITEDS